MKECNVEYLTIWSKLVKKQQALWILALFLSTNDDTYYDLYPPGGTLKIYGESLCPTVPYKTLFLSTADPASAVVREAMDKYGLEKEDSASYCLVEVNSIPRYILL